MKGLTQTNEEEDASNPIPARLLKEYIDLIRADPGNGASTEQKIAASSTEANVLISYLRNQIQSESNQVAKSSNASAENGLHNSISTLQSNREYAEDNSENKSMGDFTDD